MGCNFVIAVSVTAKLETSFCDISPEEPTLSRKNPGIVPTIFRSLLVQNYNLNAFGVQPADVVIEPDATSIDASEFMRAKELAVIGEAAAREQVPKIHRLLNRLDPQLFKPTSDTNESARATTKPAVMAVSLATVSTPARSAFGAGLSIQAGK